MQHAPLISTVKVKYLKRIHKIHKNTPRINVLRMRPLSKKRYNVIRMQSLSENRDANAQMRPLSRKRCKVFRMRHMLKKRHKSIPMRPLSKKRHRGAQKTMPVEEIALQCSECKLCHINCIWSVRMRNTAEIGLRTNIRFVITDLYAK